MTSRLCVARLEERSDVVMILADLLREYAELTHFVAEDLQGQAHYAGPEALLENLFMSSAQLSVIAVQLIGHVHDRSPKSLHEWRALPESDRAAVLAAHHQRIRAAAAAARAAEDAAAAAWVEERVQP